MSAYALKKSDIVLLSDGRYGIIEKSIGVQLSAPETTYNLEVEDFHTCFVGENPVCVHNANCGFGKYKDGMKMTEDESLDAATDFLGEGYKELLVKSGSRFVSKDGIRQVRMNYDDLMGFHGPGLHMNIELLQPKYKSIHILIKG